VAWFSSQTIWPDAEVRVNAGIMLCFIPAYGTWGSLVMKKTLLQFLFVNSCLITCLSVFAKDGHDFNMDIDSDGKPDRVVIAYPNTLPKYEDEDQTVPVNIKIHLSSQSNYFDFTLPVDLSLVYYLHPSAWNENYLFLSLTNTTSRDAKLLNYQIYRWDNNEKKLCLYVEVTGVAGSQLNNEMYPSLKQVKVFNKCLNMSDSSPALLEEEYNGYWKKNTNITANITEEKAWLYNSPNSTTKTKMYLIKNDKVVIKDYKFSQKDGEDWFLIEFLNTTKNTSIIRWVKGKSIGLALPN
jgi:hypothetical protein